MPIKTILVIEDDRDRPLDDEVELLYNQKKPVAAYYMDEGTGTVLQDTSTRTVYINGPEGEYERSDLSVRLRISKVSVSGRADSQCKAFKPRTELAVNISPVPRLALQQGQRIQLQYFNKHHQGAEPHESYQLLESQ